VIDIDAEAERRNCHLKPASEFWIRPDSGTVMRTLDLRTHLT
jgi:hypothetical protein